MKHADVINNIKLLVSQNLLAYQNKYEPIVQRHCPFKQLNNTLQTRENEGTERDTEGVDQDMSIPLKLFLVSGSQW